MARRHHIALRGRGLGKRDRAKYGVPRGGGKKRCKRFQAKYTDPARVKKAPRYRLDRLARRL